MSNIVDSSQSNHRLLIPLWMRSLTGRLALAIILYVIVFIIWTQFHWGGEENITLIGNLAILPPMLFAALIAWRTALQKHLDPRIRRTWLLLGLGTFSCLLGEAAWTYLENVLQVEPFPSIADGFFITYYPLVLWGLLKLPGAPQNGRDRIRFWFNLLILMTTASMYVSYFLLIPTMSAGMESDLLAKVLATAYPVGSLILLGGVLALLLRLPEKNTRAVLLLILLSLGFFVASDLAFGFTSLSGTYVAGNLIDAGWHISQVFMILAALRQMYQGPVANTAPRMPVVLDRLIKVLPLLAVVMGYGLVCYIAIADFFHGALGMMAGALFLTALVIGQQLISPAFVNLPIRAKVILTFLLVSVLSVSLVSLMSYLTIRSNLESAVGAHLKARAADHAAAIANLLSKQSDALEGFVLSEVIQAQAARATAGYTTRNLTAIEAELRQRDQVWRITADSTPLVEDVLNNAAADELRKFRDNFLGYENLLLTDKYGAVLAATSRPFVFDQSTSSWWQAAFHQGEGAIHITQPLIDLDTGSYQLIIVMPVRDEHLHSDLVGFLVAKYGIQNVIEMLKGIDDRHQGENSLLLPTGQLLTNNGGLVSLEQDALNALQAKATGDFAWLDFEGQSQLVSQARVEVPSTDPEEAAAYNSLGWTLIVHLDPTDAFAPLNAVWTTTLLSTLIVLAVTSGLAIALAQLLVAPISRLTAVASQIGAGNRSTKAQVEARDEIGTLADTFNVMLEALSATQQELQESEALYRSLVDESPDTIVVHGQGRALFVNPAGVKLLGAKSADELIGREMVEIIPPPDREKARRGMSSVQGLKEPTPLIQQKMHRMDGSSFEAELRAIPILYAGEPAIQFVMRDITERKQAEQQIQQLLAEVERQKEALELRVAERTEELKTLNQQLQNELIERQQLLASLSESETRFRLLYEASPDAILLLDPSAPDDSWPIVDCNESACRMNGYTHEELIGQSIDILNAAPRRPNERTEYLETIRKTGIHTYEAIHRNRVGELFPVEVSTSIISFGGRELVLGIDRDITERKQAELALKEAKDAAERAQRLAEAASQAKSEFLSRMSHELRTPMNAILGFAQLLEMSHKEPLTSMQKQRVKQIVKGGQHLLDLINEILDISRIEANRLQVSPEPVSIRESIGEVLDLTAPLAVKRHVQVVTKYGDMDSNAFVMADRQRFKQVLLNLLSNAVKYNYDGGSVIVTCQRASGSGWRISIADSGPGIPHDQLGRLFKPFERLVSEQSNVEGTGLGLTLAKHLVELMHGHIGVESVIGKGSTFWIELPAAENPIEHLQRTGGTGELSLVSGVACRILYVEDNVANFELIQQVLADYSQFELLWAADARSGFELARENRPNLILLDLHLGGQDGAELLTQLKQDEATLDIPVVVISADATPGQAQRLTSLGAQAFLTKPLDVKRFVRFIDETLGEREF